MGGLASGQPLAGPLYQQVADLLRRRIEELEWRPDIAMPNEAELARQMGVSVGTMRKALEALEQQKYITRRQGRGTYVVDASFEAELERFHQIYRVDLSRSGESYAVHCSKREAAPSDLGPLALEAGSEVIEIRRARRQRGLYATSERIVVPAAPFDGLADIDSLSEPLLFAVYRRDFHVIVSEASETIVPWNADVDLARQLGTEPHRAVLRITRIARSSSGTPVELSIRYVHLALADDEAGRCESRARPAKHDASVRSIGRGLEVVATGGAKQISFR